MRTLNLRDDLIETAVAAAKRQGITLEAWAEEAFATMLNGTPLVAPPVFTSKNPGALNLTSEMIRQVEFEDDMRRSGLLD